MVNMFNAFFGLFGDNRTTICSIVLSVYSCKRENLMIKMKIIGLFISFFSKPCLLYTSDAADE